MRNVIIVGANGFLGYHLTQRMIKDGINVYALVNKNTDSLDCIHSNSLHIIKDYSELDMPNVDLFDAMFYFAWAGNTGVERGDIALQQENIAKACEAIKNAQKYNCKKFIFAGSVMEYEAFSSINNNEICPGMGNIYSATKLVADIYLKTLAVNYDISYICLLISNIYGPGEKNNRLINKTIRQLLCDEATSFSTCTQLYDFIFIDDAIEKFYIIAKNAKNGSYYIGNPNPEKLKDFITKIGEVCGKTENQLGIGIMGETTQIIDYNLIDTGRFEREFKYRNRVDFIEGIHRTIISIEKECAL